MARCGARNSCAPIIPIEIGGKAAHGHRLDDRGLGRRGDRDGARRRAAARGFLKQETIPLERFLATPTGRLYAEHGAERTRDLAAAGRVR